MWGNKMETNMLKKLTFMALVLTSFSGLYAMEQPRTAEQIIIDDDVEALRTLVESGEVDPNKTILYPHHYSPLEYAVFKFSKKSIGYLLPITQSNEHLLKAFGSVFSWFKYYSSNQFLEGRRDSRYTALNMMAVIDLLRQEALKRGIDIHKILEKELLEAVRTYNPELVQYLLSLGGDRLNNIDKEISPINYATKRIDSLRPLVLVDQYLRAVKTRNILRDYAPDLKTRTALNILNQVREGKIAAVDFQRNPLPRDIMELVIKFVHADKEAEEKWLAIGMPRDPLDEAEPMDVGE